MAGGTPALDTVNEVRVRTRSAPGVPKAACSEAGPVPGDECAARWWLGRDRTGGAACGHGKGESLACCARFLLLSYV